MRRITTEDSSLCYRIERLLDNSGRIVPLLIKRYDALRRTLATPLVVHASVQASELHLMQCMHECTPGYFTTRL